MLVGAHGCLHSLPLWKEITLDVGWHTPRTLLAHLATSQWDSLVLLDSELHITSMS